MNVNISRILLYAYGISADSIEEMAGGYTSRCFHVRQAASEWVLKTWDRGSTGPNGFARRRAIRLVSEIVSLRPEIRLPEPMLTRRGNLTVQLADGWAALFRFVEGSAVKPWAEGAGDLPERLGAAIAQIHLLTPRITTRIAQGRRLNVAGLRRLEEILSRSPEPLHDAPFQERQTLAAMMPPLRSQVHTLLEFDDEAAQLDGRLVLRHGDLSGHNLVDSPGSPLGVLDWDEAALDEPESEFGLFFIDGGPAMLRRLLIAYKQSGGKADLDSRRIHRAALQRHVEDLAIRFERLKSPDPDLAAQALADILDWGLQRTILLGDRAALATLLSPG